jgi:hypothetical protein
LAALPPQEWSQRAEAARELARGYDWDEVAACYEAVYRTAIQGGTANTNTTGGASRW